MSTNPSCLLLHPHLGEDGDTKTLHGFRMRQRGFGVVSLSLSISLYIYTYIEAKGQHVNTKFLSSREEISQPEIEPPTFFQKIWSSLPPSANSLRSSQTMSGQTYRSHFCVATRIDIFQVELILTLYGHISRSTRSLLMLRGYFGNPSRVSFYQRYALDSRKIEELHFMTMSL